MDPSTLSRQENIHNPKINAFHQIIRFFQEYDVQCSQISAKSEAEAIEFGVRAQEYLIRQQNESELELKDLQADYQAKLDKMADQMETQWRQKLGK